MFAVEIIAASAKRYMPCCRLKSVQSPWHPVDNIQLLFLITIGPCIRNKRVPPVRRVYGMLSFWAVLRCV